jgi:hypothetical protein
VTTRRPLVTRRRPGVVTTLAVGGLLLVGLVVTGPDTGPDAGPDVGAEVGAEVGLAASPLAATVPDDHHPAGMGLVFGDEFDGTALDRSAWCTRYQYGGGAALQGGFNDSACTAAGGGTLDYLNDEQERFRDVTTHLPDGRGTPLPPGQAGDPLHVVSGGFLSLRATRTGADAGYARYEAGMIRSKREFKPSANESLYLTARVRLPDVKGSWPAFWLAPGMRAGSSQWPPEIDIFEGELNRNGDNDNMLHMNAIGTHAGGDVYYRSDEYPTTGTGPRTATSAGSGSRWVWSGPTPRPATSSTGRRSTAGTRSGWTTTATRPTRHRCC